MKKLVVTGGNRLEGVVNISGSKNAALPILAASILIPGESELTNIPNLNDIITMLRVLRALGVRAEYSDPNTVRLWTPNSIKHVAPYELVTKMRASFFVIGPLLAKMGSAKVPLPGGCAIGSRPVNIHLKGLELMGAKIGMEHGFVIASASKLKGARIFLDFQSVGATETLIMAATLAEGETIIENAAQEPEIVDLAKFLNLAGAKIYGMGSDTIRIEGVSRLKAVSYRIIPDRIEAGTFMAAAAITGGKIVVRDVYLDHVEGILSKLQEAGVRIELGVGEISICAPETIKSLDVKTMPYPGFPTDMQPQFCSLLSLAEGTSVVTETIFESRFMHVHELKRMGANIRLEGRSAIIKGVPKLSGAPVDTCDLRAGAALVLAGLAAEGETLIVDMERHIERGYEKFKDKLLALGADLKEVV